MIIGPGKSLGYSIDKGELYNKTYLFLNNRNLLYRIEVLISIQHTKSSTITTEIKPEYVNRLTVKDIMRPLEGVSNTAQALSMFQYFVKVIKK